MRRTALAGAGLSLALAAAGCQDAATAPQPTPLPAAEFALGASAAASLPARGDVAIPANARISDQEMVEIAGRVINPGDYVCPPSTPVVDWYLTAVYDVIDNEPAIFDLLYNQLLADLVPTYEALYVATDADPQYFGYDGEFTRRMIKTEKDVKRFWDIYSADIQLIGMHGSMLLDEARVANAYQVVFGVPAGTAALFASLIHDALIASTTLNGGNHPLFSFNAFAFSTNGGPIPDKIVMGDGVLEGYEALGFGDVAPQAVYAHEFAHHIQYENGYFSDPYATMGSGAERTRYTELMSDAYSAYYLTHKRGATMNRKRVEQFLQVFFQIGDCAFSNSGHHGTPNQRMAAARFGFDVADAAQKQGQILSSDAFHALFVAKYPELIAPDAI